MFILTSGNQTNSITTKIISQYIDEWDGEDSEHHPFGSGMKAPSIVMTVVGDRIAIVPMKNYQSINGRVALSHPRFINLETIKTLCQDCDFLLLAITGRHPISDDNPITNFYQFYPVRDGIVYTVGGEVVTGRMTAIMVAYKMLDRIVLALNERMMNVGQFRNKDVLVSMDDMKDQYLRPIPMSGHYLSVGDEHVITFWEDMKVKPSTLLCIDTDIPYRWDDDKLVLDMKDVPEGAIRYLIIKDREGPFTGRWAFSFEYVVIKRGTIMDWVI